MAKRSKYVKPAEPHILHAQVVASKQVSPNFIRVTVGGDDLNRFVPLGHDQWFRMFIKRPGQTELRLPTQTSKLWYAQYLMMGKDTRPTVRNYTVREFRPAGAGLFGAGPEMDIDFVAHGDSSPASAFATHAAPGEELAMLDEGLIYNPPPEAPWQPARRRRERTAGHRGGAAVGAARPEGARVHRDPARRRRAGGRRAPGRRGALADPPGSARRSRPVRPANRHGRNASRRAGLRVPGGRAAVGHRSAPAPGQRAQVAQGERQLHRVLAGGQSGGARTRE